MLLQTTNTSRELRDRSGDSSHSSSSFASLASSPIVFEQRGEQAEALLVADAIPLSGASHGRRSPGGPTLCVPPSSGWHPAAMAAAAAAAAASSMGSQAADGQGAAQTSQGEDEPSSETAWGSERELLSAARRRADPFNRLIVSFVPPGLADFGQSQLKWWERLHMRHWLLVSLDSHAHSRLAGCALRGGCVLAPQPDFEDARGGGGGIGTKAAAEAAAAAGGGGGGGGAMTLVAGQLRRAAADAPAAARWIAVRLGVIIPLVRSGVHVFACDSDATLVRDPWPLLTSALGLQSMGEGSKHDQGGDGDGDGFDGGGDGFDGGGDMLADGGDGFEEAQRVESRWPNGHADSAAAVTDSSSMA